MLIKFAHLAFWAAASAISSVKLTDDGMEIVVDRTKHTFPGISEDLAKSIVDDVNKKIDLEGDIF